MSRPTGTFVVVAFLFLSTSALSAGVCGNGVREAGEQCDDGNGENLDGCSSSCAFEQVHRINQLKLQRVTSTLCSSNAWGGAFSSTGLSNLQPGLDSAVGDGSVSILFAIRGLDDLSGTTDNALETGIINGTPLQPSDPAYDGFNDLDWWYFPDPADIDSNRTSLWPLTGSLASSVLDAGPGAARLKLILAGGPTSFFMSRFRLRATTGSSSIPLAAGSGSPPGHLASESLDPALSSFASSGDAITGELCGNISAASLQATPVPSAFIGSTCGNRFTAANSLLDVFVRGCTASILPIITATQPDAEDPAVPPAGGGPPYTLQFGAGNVVNACRDKNTTLVTLADCLSDAAYSSYWKFKTGRVIATRECPNAPVASNGGAVCEGGTVQLTATGPSGAYDWTGPNGFTSTLQNPTISNANASASGVYEVTVTLAGCTSPAGSTTVTVNPLPAQPVIAAPASVAAGASGNVASVANHPGSTYAWSIANGTIGTGQGTHQITFTAGVTGSVELSVTEETNGCTSAAAARSVPIFGPPLSVTATATASNRVLIEWSVGSAASAYEIVRTAASGITILGPTAALTWEDTTAAADTAYLYAVRSIDGSSNRSSASSPDLATTVIFSDEPLQAGSTPIRATHMNQLRTAITAVRVLAGQAPPAGDNVTAGSIVHVQHLTGFRTTLQEARQALLLSLLNFDDPTLTAGTPVRASHVTQLRSGTK